MAEQQYEQTLTLLQRTYVKFVDLLEEAIECVASWRIGQLILKHTDRCLWIIEKSAEWSVPNNTEPKQIDSNGTFGKPAPLIRPLPWLLFLPMLILLRFVRAGLNMGTFFLGMESVKPVSVVRFIQLRRRRVRTIKYLGFRRMRQRKVSSQQSSEKYLTWKERIYKTVSGAICFNNNFHDVSEQITTKDLTDEQPVKASTGEIDLKRKYIEMLQNDDLEWDDIGEDEELIKKMEEFANEESEEDPDSKPAEDDCPTDEELISDDDDEASTSTVQILQRPSSHNSLTNETIAEENEESDSTTVSVNSEDASSRNKKIQHKVPPSKPELVINNKIEVNGDSLICDTPTDSAVTSEEYYSPQNSISTTPEPTKEISAQRKESLKFFDTQTTSEEVCSKIDNKSASENLISAEKTQDVNNG